MQVRTNLKGSALYLACQGGHPEIVRLLLDAGADVRGGFQLEAWRGGWPWNQVRTRTHEVPYLCATAPQPSLQSSPLPSDQHRYV